MWWTAVRIGKIWDQKKRGQPLVTHTNYDINTQVLNGIFLQDGMTHLPVAKPEWTSASEHHHSPFQPKAIAGRLSKQHSQSQLPIRTHRQVLNIYWLYHDSIVAKRNATEIWLTQWYVQSINSNILSNVNKSSHVHLHNSWGYEMECLMLVTSSRSGCKHLQHSDDGSQKAQVTECKDLGLGFPQPFLNLWFKVDLFNSYSSKQLWYSAGPDMSFTHMEPVRCTGDFNCLR